MRDNRGYKIRTLDLAELLASGISHTKYPEVRVYQNTANKLRSVIQNTANKLSRE